ncbi:MAG TPA: hypothetical protein VGR26_06520 [Acidimicrobiales bacterium]|nr:hypothetical protein [Acidimicrobiales bacterium]
MLAFILEDPDDDVDVPASLASGHVAGARRLELVPLLFVALRRNRPGPDRRRPPVEVE